VQLFMPDSTQQGAIHDVSLGGLFVRSQRLWDPGSRVQTVFAVPDGEINALCSVVHVLPPEVGRDKGHPPGMGMRFEVLNRASEVALKTHVERVQRATRTPPPLDLPALRANRQLPRWTDATTVRVTLQEGSAQEAWMRNISQGGMFVETTQPPARGSVVTVELGAGNAVMVLHAEVVHVVDSAMAFQCAQPAGVGLQFVDLTREKRLAVEAYVAGRVNTLEADLRPPMPSAPLDRVLSSVKRLYDGLEAQDALGALGLSRETTATDVKTRVAALERVLSLPPPEATPPQRARIQGALKMLPRLSTAALRDVDQRPIRTGELAMPPLAEVPPTPVNHPQADTLWAEALSAEKSGDLAEAKGVLTQGQRRFPQDPRFRIKLQQVTDKTNRSAAEDLVQSAEMMSSTPGMKMQAAARAHEALTLWRHAEVMKRALHVFLTVGDHQAVVALARDLTLLDRKDPAPYQALLCVYEAAGHWALAGRAVEALLSLRPNDAELKKRHKVITSKLRS
jgi:Tfp pilus assembly protein PilZ